MSREILTLKKSNKTITIQANTSAPKSAPDKTQQEAPQQPQKKNKAEAHARMLNHTLDRYQHVKSYHPARDKVTASVNNKITTRVRAI